MAKTSFQISYSQNNISQKEFGVRAYVLLNNLVYSNPQIRDPTGPKKSEIMNIEVFGPSHNKIEIEKLSIQNAKMKQNSSAELLPIF